MALDVLPANADDAADATELIGQEEQAAFSPSTIGHIGPC
jgi:hypothetical protein